MSIYRNMGADAIKLKTENKTVVLQPGHKIELGSVDNLDEVEEKVKVTENLTEVNTFTDKDLSEIQVKTGKYIHE